jgi:hypothetical protein
MSRPGTAAGPTGRPRRKPWAWSQPSRRRNACCWRKPAGPGIQRRHFGDGPAHQHTADLQAQVVMEAAGPVALHHEAVAALRGPAPAPARRLRGAAEVALLLVRRQLAAGATGRSPIGAAPGGCGHAALLPSRHRCSSEVQPGNGGVATRRRASEWMRAEGGGGSYSRRKWWSRACRSRWTSCRVTSTSPPVSCGINCEAWGRWRKSVSQPRRSSATCTSTWNRPDIDHLEDAVARTSAPEHSRRKTPGAFAPWLGPCARKQRAVQPLL